MIIAMTTVVATCSGPQTKVYPKHAGHDALRPHPATSPDDDHQEPYPYRVPPVPRPVPASLTTRAT